MTWLYVLLEPASPGNRLALLIAGLRIVGRMTIHGIDRCPLASVLRGQRGYSLAPMVSGRSKAPGAARQGISVALSADGNVAIAGGLASDGGGSSSVFTRSGGVWTQGETLVSAGAVGKSSSSVALSADGRIVLLGGSNDNGGIGAAWTFAQQAGHWI